MMYCSRHDVYFHTRPIYVLCLACVQFIYLKEAFMPPMDDFIGTLY